MHLTLPSNPRVGTPDYTKAVTYTKGIMEKGMCNYDGFNTRFFRFDALEKNLSETDSQGKSCFIT